MTERLADINARVDGVRQLGTVVNAMRGIAAARSQQARKQLDAVDRYAATVAVAIGRALALIDVKPSASPSTKPAVLLFCAEQGFAGAFSERVLDEAAGGAASASAAAAADLAASTVFIIGSRGIAIGAARGIDARWTAAMPSHSSGIPTLADRVAEALYGLLAEGSVDRIEAVFSRWQPGHGVRVERRPLFPIELSTFESPLPLDKPVVNLPPAQLLAELSAEHLHAQLCQVALHAFAAENEARVEAMAAARTEVERQLSDMQAMQRRVRQDEITAEIIELAAGETASAR
ncbi:FoF1 ATP synthase subunit gamma [soil metagenome]